MSPWTAATLLRERAMYSKMTAEWGQMMVGTDG